MALVTSPRAVTITMAVALPGACGPARPRSARAATSASNGLKLDSMNPASAGTLPSSQVCGQDADDKTARPAAAAAARSAARPGDATDAGDVMAAR